MRGLLAEAQAELQALADQQGSHHAAAEQLEELTQQHSALKVCTPGCCCRRPLLSKVAKASSLSGSFLRTAEPTDGQGSLPTLTAQCTPMFGAV